MSKKTKSLLIFIGTITITSIGESFVPLFPFIAVGCFITYMLGRWERDNEI